MRASILALVVAMAATPVLAKTAPKPAEPDHTGPVPYSDLAAVDAKLNAAPTHKHKMMKKKAHPAAAASAGASASATTPSK
jgi:hypothetical protein